MTESQWLTCEDPKQMLAALGPEASRRKTRLFACACCRRVWHLYTRESVREAIETGERYADGLACVDEVRAALAVVRKAKTVSPLNSWWESALSAAVMAVREDLGTDWVDSAAKDVADAFVKVAIRDRRDPMKWFADYPEFAAERRAQCDLLRDVFRPFAPVVLDPAWLDVRGAVLSLARGIYERRAFADLPVLADALEEAGCQDAALLAHCRGPGPHIRGCWALDLVLGKQ